jgi:hypothetical protein
MSFIKDNLYNPNDPSVDMANFLRTPGILSGKMPAELFNKIKKETEGIQEDFTKADFFGDRLAGNIRKEYQLKKTKADIEKFLIDKAAEYNKAFDYLKSMKILSKDAKLGIDVTWVNFQTKGEFNPIHNHTGVYSFVGFIKIPYTKEDLEKGPGQYSNSNCSGGLTFVYTDILGRVQDYTFRPTTEDEGSFFFFPAPLTHTVYPFHDVDGYRITVSGNLIFKV